MTQKNKKNADAAEVPQEGVQTDQTNTAEAPADVAQETPVPAIETAPVSDTSGEEAEITKVAARTSDKKSASAAKSTVRAPKTPAKGSETVRESAAQRVAREVFRSHPDRPAIYVTSDGTSFFNRCDAVNYGRTLKDTTVVEVTNQKNKA